jgi:hypothetical protein
MRAVALAALAMLSLTACPQLTGAPTVTLSAEPSTVTSGTSSTLTWSSSDATACEASGAWSGAKPTAGSQSTGALTATSAYTLTCTGEGGTASQSVTVNVSTSPAPEPAPSPTVTLSADPTSVASGGASTLRWSATNATGCQASGAWSGVKSTAGSQSTGALTATSTYTLTCTGSGGSASQSVTVNVAASPSPPPPPPPTPPPPPPPAPPVGSALTTVYLTGSAGGASVPFAFGQAFRKGDVPTGATVTADGLSDFQITVKNRWRDGSVKFAVIAGRTALTANTPRAITLRSAASGAASVALTTTELKATGATASISFAPHGTVSWSGTDWDAPFITWAQGPQMSSWVYRKPIGSDAHLVGWIEVRLYAGGSVEVVPWIENGYVLKPGPGERGGTATFALGGSQRFNAPITLYNHTRTYLGSGTTFSHWLGSDPGLSVRHDTTYLMATRLVPNYAGVTGPSSPLWGSTTTSFTPLAQHDFPSTMGNAGYHKSIGPLPEWDVAYLTSGGDVRAWRAVQVHGYAAGRFGYHLRDETTNRAVRSSMYPTLVLGTGMNIPDTGASTTNQYTPTPSGGAPAKYTPSHGPSIGFMAYLLTGRWYFVDELQLLAGAMSLKDDDAGRLGGQGVINGASAAWQTRGSAWALRDLMLAAAMTADDDMSLKNEFVAKVHANIDFYYAKHVAQPSNPLGVVQPSGNYNPGSGRYEQGLWQDDFLTGIWGWLKDVEVHSAAYDGKLDSWLGHKYRSPVGRLGDGSAGTYCYRRATPYQAPIAPSENPNWNSGSGPWYSSWGQVYAVIGYPNDCAASAALIGDGVGLPGPGEFPDAYWANFHPAIAYAVDHGAAGALDAYRRMVSASNYAAGAAGFNDRPVWSVRPRNGP